MRDELIEKNVLQILANRDCGAKESTLREEVSIRIDRPLMPRKDLDDALTRLSVRGAVKKEGIGLGSVSWSITSLGRQMMTEEGWI